MTNERQLRLRKGGLGPRERRPIAQAQTRIAALPPYQRGCATSPMSALTRSGWVRWWRLTTLIAPSSIDPGKCKKGRLPEKVCHAHCARGPCDGGRAPVRRSSPQRDRRNASRDGGRRGGAERVLQGGAATARAADGSFERRKCQGRRPRDVRGATDAARSWLQWAGIARAPRTTATTFVAAVTCPL